MSRILALIPVFFAVAACATSSRDGSIPAPTEADVPWASVDLFELVPNHAMDAARRAHAWGERRLFAVMDHAIIFPAASRADAERLGYRVIPMTSDGRRFADESDYNNTAHAYAAAWNREMLRLTR